MTNEARHHAAAATARRRGALHRSIGQRRVGQAIGAGRDPSSRQAEPLEELRAEARYRRERLALYKARLFAGRVRGLTKLKDLQRSSDGAAERLRRARENLAPRSTVAQGSLSSEEMQRDE